MQNGGEQLRAAVHAAVDTALDDAGVTPDLRATAKQAGLDAFDQAISSPLDRWRLAVRSECRRVGVAYDEDDPGGTIFALVTWYGDNGGLDE